MIELKITVTTQGELDAYMAELGYVRAAQAAAPTPKTNGKSRVVEAPAEVKATTVSPDTGAGELETKAAPKIDYQNDIAKRVLQLVRDSGKQAATDLLADFGAPNAREVPEAKWPELVEALKKAVGE